MNSIPQWPRCASTRPAGRLLRSMHVPPSQLGGPARITGRHPRRINRQTLYVSNRGHNSIACSPCGIDGGGALALEQVVSTEGDWPRNFSLDRAERWLLVANQRSDSVVVFGRDPENGRLTPTRQRIALPSPVCLGFA